MLENDEYEYEVAQAAANKFRTRFRRLTQEPLIEFSGSVVKRTSEDIDTVHAKLVEEGFEPTSHILDGKVHYHENESGINLTLVETRRGTLVFPSGPVRGNVFGKNAVDIDINR